MSTKGAKEHVTPHYAWCHQNSNSFHNWFPCLETKRQLLHALVNVYNYTIQYSVRRHTKGNQLYRMQRDYTIYCD